MSEHFSIPQNLIFGERCVESIHEILERESCSKVFLVSDRGLEKIGLVKEIEAILEGHDISVVTFSDIMTNPTTEAVTQGFDLWNVEKPGVIVALGGGSPMDVAKAIATLAVYGGDIRDYEGAQIVPGPVLPIIAIPTTAGTGSEVTASSVITDSETLFKFSVFSDVLKPKYALLDPTLIMSLPKHVAAMTGIDAFIHAMESYLSLKSTMLTETFSLRAMKLISDGLVPFVDERSNYEAAEKMLMGSMLAGVAFTHTRLGNIHAMSHPLSGHFGVAHGIANASLMVTILEFNAPECVGKYHDIYEILTGKRVDDFKSSMLIDEVKKLLTRIGLPWNASDLVEVKNLEHPIDDILLNKLVDDALKSGNVAVNPRHTERSDVLEMYIKTLDL